MSFLSPERLWLLLGVAALAGLYLATMARRSRYAVKFTNLDLLATVAPAHPGWRRHLTALGFVAALAALVVAFAQPARAERMPVERATVIMAIDTSLSMDATDVAPSRFLAAKSAAHDFVDVLPESIELGLVNFDGVATLRVPPTPERDTVHTSIDGLELGPATATGDAILVSLGAIEAHQGELAEQPESSSATGGDPTDDDPDAPPAASIVLLSDGETTAGTPDEVAIAAAVEAGVPVSTIAFGTPHGTLELPDGGPTVGVPVNLPALQRIADQTGGTFFTADTAEQLDAVYADIGATVGFDEEQREVTAWFVGLALVLLGATAAGSLLWFNRLP